MNVPYVFIHVYVYIHNCIVIVFAVKTLCIESKPFTFREI